MKPFWIYAKKTHNSYKVSRFVTSTVIKYSYHLTTPYGILDDNEIFYEVTQPNIKPDESIIDMKLVESTKKWETFLNTGIPPMYQQNL